MQAPPSPSLGAGTRASYYAHIASPYSQRRAHHMQQQQQQFYQQQQQQQSPMGSPATVRRRPQLYQQQQQQQPLHDNRNLFFGRDSSPFGRSSPSRRASWNLNEQSNNNYHVKIVYIRIKEKLYLILFSVRLCLCCCHDGQPGSAEEEHAASTAFGKPC